MTDEVRAVTNPHRPCRMLLLWLTSPLWQVCGQARSRPSSTVLLEPAGELHGLPGLANLSQMSMGPEASLSLMMGQMIDNFVYGDPHSVPEDPAAEGIAIAVMTTFTVGVLTSILGLLRLGFLDVVLSRALLRGFITAIGVVSQDGSTP